MASFALPDDKSNDQILVLILNDLSEAFNKVHHSFFHLASKMLYSLFFSSYLIHYFCISFANSSSSPGPLTLECQGSALGSLLLSLYIQLLVISFSITTLNTTYMFLTSVFLFLTQSFLIIRSIHPVIYSTLGYLRHLKLNICKTEIPDFYPQYPKPIPPEIYSISANNTILFAAQSKKKVRNSPNSTLSHSVSNQSTNTIGSTFKIYSEAHQLPLLP